MLFLSSNSGWQPKWKIGSQNKIYLNVILKIIQFVLKDKDLSENYESKILDGSNFCFKNGNKNKTPERFAQIEECMGCFVFARTFKAKESAFCVSGRMTYMLWDGWLKSRLNVDKISTTIYIYDHLSEWFNLNRQAIHPSIRPTAYVEIFIRKA